jgi:hypothetical protein
MYQQRLSNGEWYDIDETRFQRLAVKALELDQWFAPRQSREPMTTVDELREALERPENRNGLKFDVDWYSAIRVKPAPVASKHVQLVRCNCWHAVEPALVMNASRGSSCPGCYDRMSD